MTPRMSRPRGRMLPACLAAGALILAAVSTARTAAPPPQFDDPPASAFEPTGLQPAKGYFSQLPFERVDMINGGVILSFTDLVLPGNAGMDLRLVRNYNSQRNGRRWEFGIDGVPIRVGVPAGNGQECCDYPLLIMADGTTHQTKPRDSVYGDTVFLTEQFWRRRCPRR